jgi:hypothetical protein
LYPEGEPWRDLHTAGLVEKLAAGMSSETLTGREVGSIDVAGARQEQQGNRLETSSSAKPR